MLDSSLKGRILSIEAIVRPRQGRSVTIDSIVGFAPDAITFVTFRDERDGLPIC